MSMKVIDSLTPEQNDAVLAVIDTAIDKAFERAGHTERLLRLPEVIEMVGLGRSSILNRVRDGSFPAGLTLDEGSRARLWPLSSVQQWVKKQVDNNDDR